MKGYTTQLKNMIEWFLKQETFSHNNVYKLNGKQCTTANCYIIDSTRIRGNNTNNKMLLFCSISNARNVRKLVKHSPGFLICLMTEAPGIDILMLTKSESTTTHIRPCAHLDIRIDVCFVLVNIKLKITTTPLLVYNMVSLSV